MRSSLFIAALFTLSACTADSALQPERETPFDPNVTAFSSTYTSTDVDVTVEPAGDVADVRISWRSTGAPHYLVGLKAGEFQTYELTGGTSQGFRVPVTSREQTAKACVSAKAPSGPYYLQPSCVDWVVPARQTSPGGGNDGGDDTPGVPPGVWPNEPAGFTRVLDDGFENCRSDSPWTGWDAQTVVERAPGSILGENCAVRQKYTVGQEGGGGNEISLNLLRHDYKEVYLAFWVRLDEKWQGHDSFVNKVATLRTSFEAETPGGNNQGIMWIEAYGGDNGPLEMAVVPQMYGGCGTALWRDRPDLEVKRGKWHLVEAVMKMASTRYARDGSIQVWLDGTPVVTRHGLCTTGRDEGGILAVTLSGMWGGRWDSLQNADQGMWYDRVRVSAR